MCGVCGEWMTKEELAKHSATAHVGLDHVSVKAAKRVALYTTPAGIVLILLVLTWGLSVTWLGLPLLIWALVVFVVLLVPVGAVALKPSQEAYANATFRCWVCDALIPHRTLSQHLQENHPDEARDYRTAEVSFAAIAILFPLAVVVPQLWRFLDPNLSLYLYLGPELGLLLVMAVIAVYASHWPRRIARSRTQWDAADHPS